MTWRSYAWLLLGLAVACSKIHEPPPTTSVEQAAGSVEPPAEEPFTAPACDREVPPDPPLRVPYFSKGKWGLADRNGVLVVEAIYDDVAMADSATIAVQRGELWGVIDGEGHELIATQWKRLAGLSSTHAVMADDRDLVHLRDMCDQVALPGEYDVLYEQPPYIAKRAGQWALLDVHGEPLIGWSGRELQLHGIAVLQQSGDAEVLVVHADGRAWMRAREHLAIFGFWPEQPTLVTHDTRDPLRLQACLYDAGAGQSWTVAHIRRFGP
ncbi:MAG: WG repeat-containing protein [Deltaproteobacteria bacterium]|nr:WG repeat-containing protein [Deltaproteobacteria bacterium]